MGGITQPGRSRPWTTNEEKRRNAAALVSNLPSPYLTAQLISALVVSAISSKSECVPMYTLCTYSTYIDLSHGKEGGASAGFAAWNSPPSRYHSTRYGG
jgi:hypothetical protein